MLTRDGCPMGNDHGARRGSKCEPASRRERDMVSRRSFMQSLGVLGAAGVYLGETLIAANQAAAGVADKSTTVWLDANENPAGPPASAVDAMVRGAPESWR